MVIRQVLAIADWKVNPQDPFDNDLIEDLKRVHFISNATQIEPFCSQMYIWTSKLLRWDVFEFKQAILFSNVPFHLKHLNH